MILTGKTIKYAEFFNKAFIGGCFLLYTENVMESDEILKEMFGKLHDLAIEMENIK